MDVPRTVVDFALVARSRLPASGTMRAMRASECWDDQAVELDDQPDHGLQDPAVRDARVD